MINTYAGQLAVIEYHLSDGYEVPFGNIDRRNFYAVSAVPTSMHDGLYDAWPYSTYIQKFLQRQAVPSPMTLKVEVRNVSGDNYIAKLTACYEAGNPAMTARAYIAIGEDHYPSSPDYMRNTCRDGEGPVNIDLVPGQCSVVELPFSIQPSWVKENLLVVGWVQENKSSGPAEVYQAGQDAWPWGPNIKIGDLNCDDLVDFGDINPFVQILTDPSGWQNTYPDCPFLNGDINEDGLVNFDDINPFVDLLTGPP